jgi:hypothetical protein
MSDHSRRTVSEYYSLRKKVSAAYHGTVKIALSCLFGLMALVSCGARVVTVRVQATTDDGRAMPDALVGLSHTGYGVYDGKRTNSEGFVSLSLPRGQRILLMGLGNAAYGCLSPVSVGPSAYPNLIHVVYSVDGCREEFNIVHAGFLQASIHGGKFSQARVMVSFSDDSPAYNANVTIVSKRRMVPFAAGFLTDKKGYVDLPIPSNQEFQLHASIHRSRVDCDSQSLLFNTDIGVRWQQVASNQSGMAGWSNLSAAPISLVLTGTSCTH